MHEEEEEHANIMMLDKDGLAEKLLTVECSKIIGRGM